MSSNGLVRTETTVIVIVINVKYSYILRMKRDNYSSRRIFIKQSHLISKSIRFFALVST